MLPCCLIYQIVVTLENLYRMHAPDLGDKYLHPPCRSSTMTLLEIIDLEIQQRNVERLKQNAKRQSEQAKAAQVRLKMQKAQAQFNKAKQAVNASTI